MTERIFLLALSLLVLPRIASAGEIYMTLGDTITWCVEIEEDGFTVIEYDFDGSQHIFTGDIRTEGETLLFSVEVPLASCPIVCGKYFVKRVQDGREYLVETTNLAEFEEMVAVKDTFALEFLLGGVFYRVEHLPDDEWIPPAQEQSCQPGDSAPFITP